MRCSGAESDQPQAEGTSDGRVDRTVIVIRPGYLDGNWTTASCTDQGLRDKVGAAHWPLASLLNTVIGTGPRIEALCEEAEPTPVVLSLRAIEPDASTSRIVEPLGGCGGQRATDPTPTSESTRSSSGGRGARCSGRIRVVIPRAEVRRRCRGLDCR